MRENEIEAYLVKRVTAIGGLAEKLIYTSKSGSPDRWVFYKGKLYLCELKQQKGRLTGIQINEQRKWKMYEVPYFVLRSTKDVDDFIKNNLGA